MLRETRKMSGKTSLHDGDWKEFEKAVGNFLSSIGGTARITHDKKTPDKDTGLPRQRDVWIEGKICNFPIKILVSCKHYKRKLNQLDLDVFIGELASSRANKGVIYSKIGFTAGALTKAKKNDISCCRLYFDKEPEMPEMLLFKYYMSKPLVILKPLVIPSGLEYWNQLFNLDFQDTTENSHKKLIDWIEKEFQELEKLAFEDIKLGNKLPKDIAHRLTFKNEEITAELELALTWKYFEAKTKCYRINGSYDFIDENFSGSQSSPAIDLKSSDPGEGWEPLQEKPKININEGIIVLRGLDYRTAILSNLNNKKLPEHLR